MNKKNIIIRIIISLIFFAAFLSVFMVGFLRSTNADMIYKSWDVHATVNDDGDIRVVNTYDIKLDRRSSDGEVKPWRQLYRTFTLDSGGTTGMSDISVKNLDTGQTYSQMEPTCTNPSMYTTSSWDSRCAGHWYIGTVDYYGNMTGSYQDVQVTDPDTNIEHNVELGWNIPSTTSSDSMRFEVSYTLENIVTQYKDVDYFWWTLFSDDNSVPITQLSVQLDLPQSTVADDTMFWVHYEGDAESSQTADGRTITASAKNVPSEQYFDIRVIYDSTSAGHIERQVNYSAGQEISSEEAAKADEWAAQLKKQKNMRLMSWVLVLLIGGGSAIAAIIMSIRLRGRMKYQGPIVYWRDLPQMSPAAAAKLSAYMEPLGDATWLMNALTATVMSLVSKGAIAVYPGHAALYRGIDLSQPNPVSLAQMLDTQDARREKNMSTIVILPAVFSHREALGLCRSEEAALDMLMIASQRIGSPVFDFDQMNQCFKGDSDAYKIRDAFEVAATAEFTQLNAVKRVGGGVRALAAVAICVGLLSFMWFLMAERNLALVLCLSVPIVILGMVVGFITPTRIPTTPDQPYVGQVIGLKRYLEDFSDFSDRGVLDMKLWGRYMVYAAAFGISDRVLQQLVKVYPQVMDPQWLDSNVSSMNSLMYWSMRPTSARFMAHGGFAGMQSGFDFASFSTSMGGSLGSQLTAGFDSISSTITHAMPSSSGSSFGGGGHGGGSFGGGGGSGGGGGGGR